MMEREKLWGRVQDALDERRDPLHDEVLQELFANHPALLAEYAQLERTLTALDMQDSATAGIHAQSVQSLPVHRRIGALLTTLAAAVVLLLAARLTRETPDDLHGVRALGHSQVLDYELTVNRVGPTQAQRNTRRMGGALHTTNTITNDTSSGEGVGVRWMQHTMDDETRTR